MDVTSLVMTPLIGGPRSGILALELSLGAGGKRFTPAQLAREVEKAGSALRSRVLSLEVPNPFDHEEREVSALLRSLNDAGFALSISLPAIADYPSYLDLVGYRVAWVTRDSVAPWKAHEIRYLPAGEEWREPEFYFANRDAPKYLEVRKEGDFRKALEFIRQARATWHIVQVPKHIFLTRFIGGAE